jgi:hypothetical protein
VHPVPIRIYTVSEWGAAPPKAGLTLCPRPSRIIIHHTDGHHREITNPANESLDEAFRYAREIQAFHMGPKREWIDSGHNFLVTRAGQILQGRHLTVSALEARHMVVSAHCPGQNEQVGIEHEHVPGELMTTAQVHASARLIAWVSWRTGRTKPMACDPHSKHYPTRCPDNISARIRDLRSIAADIMGGTY